jgi:predicted Zn-dependent peptidase
VTDVGGTWRWTQDRDSASAEVTVPASASDLALDILDRGFIHAKLQPGEYAMRLEEWVHMEAKATLSLEQGERFVLFGAHPYGYAGAGTTPVTRADAQALHDRLWQPSHATLIVVGDVDVHAVGCAQIATVEGAATMYGRPDEPLDHVRSYPTRIGRVTRADVVRAAARYLRAEALHVLLFTDARSFDAAPLGLGPPVVLAASP